MADPIIIHAFYVEEPIFIFIRLIHPPLLSVKPIAGKKSIAPHWKPKAPT